MNFTLQHTDPNSRARTGLIQTDHGEIKTPIFMPVGTVGSVKGVHFQELREEVNAQIILAIHTIFTFVRGLKSWNKPVDCINSIAGIVPF